MTELARDKLKALRERSGMSIRDVAARLGQASSTYASYERGYKRAELPQEYARRLVPVFTGAGKPVITKGDVMALAGIDEADDDGSEPGAFKNFSFDEIDVQIAAGMGEGEQPLDHDGNHVVLARWQMPSDYFLTVNSAPENVKIIRVIGDSMEPDYFSGERIMVDIAHRIPSPPAVYVLFDGFGIVLKQLEVISREPARVRVTSRNPNYRAYEADLDEIKINGRVIGKWTWK